LRLCGLNNPYFAPFAFFAANILPSAAITAHPREYETQLYTLAWLSQPALKS
jgi:hypothetical protein